MKKKFYLNIFLFQLPILFSKLTFRQKQVSFLQKGPKLSVNVFSSSVSYMLKMRPYYPSIFSGSLNSLQALSLAAN